MPPIAGADRAVIESTAPAFKENARKALADPVLQSALSIARPRFVDKRRKAKDRLPEFDALRDQARDIKNHTLAHIDLYLEAFEAKVKNRAARSIGPRHADEARGIVLGSAAACRRRPLPRASR